MCHETTTKMTKTKRRTITTTNITTTKTIPVTPLTKLGELEKFVSLLHRFATVAVAYFI